MSLITDDRWFAFIKAFFDLDVADQWLAHVIKNWNNLKDEPGCECLWNTSKNLSEPCEDYNEMIRYKSE